MKITYLILIIFLVIIPGTDSCVSSSQNKNKRNSLEAVKTYSYEVVNSWPHDPDAFTQGLVFKNGVLYESTGRHRSSSLRIVDLKTGNIKKRVNIPDQYFAEGITVLNGKIFQLTWLNHKGFIYDQGSLKLLGEFDYEGNGWGLTDDGHFLIISDGTNALRFLDSEKFQTYKVIKVYENGMPLVNLNELEYINGEVYANIWHSNRIVRIDPESGKLLGWIDLTGLVPNEARENEAAVLNGIAYDQEKDRLFVTGKLWSKLFEIRLIEKR
jgi:glutamine cyclotransferase